MWAHDTRPSFSLTLSILGTILVVGGSEVCAWPAAPTEFSLAVLIGDRAQNRQRILVDQR
jgi:hypothetical protein